MREGGAAAAAGAAEGAEAAGGVRDRARERAPGGPPRSQHATEPRAARNRSDAPGFTPPRWLRPLLFVASLLPFLWIAGALASDWLNGTRLLGSNPIEEIEHFTGKWALAFLALSLAVTPARRVFAANWLARYRRTFGLFAFFYAAVHLLVYFVLDLELFWGELSEDIVERPYITIGMTAFVLLVPLALTSTKGAIRRLGKRWTALHRLAYVVPVLGLVHFFMAVKRDITQPLVFAVVFALLLGWRVARSRAGRARPA